MATTAAQDDEEFFRARGFGLKIGFGERPALLVVDLVKAFTDADRPLGAKLDDQIAAANRLIEVAHRREVPVIFSSVSYGEPNLRDGR
jgi:maleamate amidohydrolase